MLGTVIFAWTEPVGQVSTTKFGTLAPNSTKDGISKPHICKEGSELSGTTLVQTCLELSALEPMFLRHCHQFYMIIDQLREH